MGIVRRALEILLPRGHAWRLPASTASLIDGLADTLDRPRVFAQGALVEAHPGTATAMLPEWHAALGQRYDATQTVEAQRRKLSAILSAQGGVTLNQLNEQMHKELPQVDFEEIVETDTTDECGVGECGLAEAGSTLVGSEFNPFIYLVTGTVDNDTEAARVISVIAHFAPLHLLPISSLVILTDSGTAECGLDVCGLAECGSTG